MERGKKTGDSDSEDVEQQSLTGIVSDSEAIDRVHLLRLYDADDSYDREARDRVHSLRLYKTDDSYDREARDRVHSLRLYKELDRAAEKQSLADISKPSETQSRADLSLTSKTPSLADMSEPSETPSRADLSVTSETPSLADFCESSESQSAIHAVCYDQLAIQQLESYKGMLPALPSTPEGVLQVTFKDSETIELLILKFLNETLSAANNLEGFNYIFDEGTTVFDKRVGYYVMVDPVKQSKHTHDLAAKLDATLTTRLLRSILEPTNEVINKRGLYYLNSYLVGGKSTKGLPKIDRIVHHLCCTFKCTRSSLGITASSKGLVYGDLSMVIGDTLYDFKDLKCGSSVPSDTQSYKISSHRARFILIIEKETVFTKIIEADFVHRIGCILITGKGQPDVSTRVFVRHLREQLMVPVFALVDCNPYGFRILSCYKHGSIKMSYDNSRLATPDIKWLGILPKELEKHKMSQCGTQMTKQDLKIVNDVLKKKYVKDAPEWFEQLEEMHRTKLKVDIEALCNSGDDYLTAIYLPQKLSRREWID